MNQLLSREEWNGYTSEGKRRILGENPITGNYINFFTTYFGKDMHALLDFDSYDLYREWWICENTPLGKALS